MPDRYWLLLVSRNTNRTLLSLNIRQPSPLSVCQAEAKKRGDEQRYFIVDDVTYQRMWKEYLS